MVVNDLTRGEIDELNNNMDSFQRYINSYCKDQNITLSQATNSFLRFWAKHIIFMNYLKEYDYIKWHCRISGIISDMFFFSASIILNQKRYMYLNLRSFIESFMRLLLNEEIENGQITRKAFEKFRLVYKNDILNADDFSIIKSVYQESCVAIHNPLFEGNDLAKGIRDCLEYRCGAGGRYTVMGKNFNNVITVTSIFIKLLIYKYKDQINGAFHRRKRLMAKLVGDKMVESLSS